MPEIIRKVLDCEIKKLGERQYEFTASTMEQDRDGDVIDADGWDLRNFKKNPVIMYAHDYRTLPIGRAPKVWVSEGKLKNTVEFTPEGSYEFADIVERLVNAGYLKTESVGFIPKKWDDGDGEKAPRRKYTKQELLEISIVPIPSNPNALREAVEKGVITEEQFDSFSEQPDDKITKPEETEDYIRIPNPKDKQDHEGHRIRTIDIDADEGIKAIYCGQDKIVMTYLFSKDKGWTMERAKAWVKEHSKALTQAEIKDELDYVLSILQEYSLNRDNLNLAKSLYEELKRIAGSDMPVHIEQENLGEFLRQEMKRKLTEVFNVRNTD